MTRTWTALAVACALTLAACSSSGSTPKTSTTALSTAPPARVVSAKAAGAALLVQADVGKSLKRGPYAPPVGPPYCQPATSPTLAKSTSATDVVGVLYASAKPQASIEEDIYLY